MTRRVAVHRVWKVDAGEWLAMQVVEWDPETQTVGRIFPFDEELRHTEWWGGLAVVASFPLPARMQGETFKAYCSRVNTLCPPRFVSDVPLCAWYVTDFNVSDSEFTPTGRMIPFSQLLRG